MYRFPKEEARNNRGRGYIEDLHLKAEAPMRFFLLFQRPSADLPKGMDNLRWRKKNSNPCFWQENGRL